MTDYWVRPTNGLDAQSGLSYALAKQTTSAGLALLTTAGDNLYLCAEADEEIGGALTWPAVSGTADSRIQIIGANSGGTVDGTQYVIKPSGAWSGTRLMQDSATVTSYWSMKNVDLNASANSQQAANAFGYSNTNANKNYRYFENCWFHEASSHGFINYRGLNYSYKNCRFYNNGGHGLANGASGNLGQSMYVDGCQFYDNTTVGLQALLEYYYISNCEFWGNGEEGFRSNTNSCRFIQLLNNTFYDNGHSGVEISGDPTGLVREFYRNTFVSNGLYGLDEGTGSGDDHQSSHIYENHFYNNTSGESRGGTRSSDIYGNIAGDPLFTDAASADFSLQSTSPLFQGARNSMNIGARGLAAAGGGGGGPLIGGRLVRG